MMPNVVSSAPPVISYDGHMLEVRLLLQEILDELRKMNGSLSTASVKRWGKLMGAATEPGQTYTDLNYRAEFCD